MFKHVCLRAALGLILCAGAAAAQTPARVRGTVDQLSANTLTVTTRSGDKVAVKLADPTRVVAIAKASRDEIKPGSGVGIASLPQPDGSLRALEVTLVPAGQPNTPVNTDWDLAPSSRMTNGTVGTVATTDGRTLTVNYGNGEVKVVVPDDVPVVTTSQGDRAMLMPGAHVVVFARKADDGSLSAGAVAVGTGGVVPPM